MGDPRRPVPQGNPRSKTCRHCGGPRLRVRRALLCEKCDVGYTPDHQPIRPTWKPRLR